MKRNKPGIMIRITVFPTFNTKTRFCQRCDDLDLTRRRGIEPQPRSLLIFFEFSGTYFSSVFLALLEQEF